MMENKQKYERASLAVLMLSTKDVIATSGGFGDKDDGIVLPEDIF